MIKDSSNYSTLLNFNCKLNKNVKPLQVLIHCEVTKTYFNEQVCKENNIHMENIENINVETADVKKIICDKKCEIQVYINPIPKPITLNLLVITKLSQDTILGMIFYLKTMLL